MDERKWIQAAQQGDNQALARLLKQHFPYLVKVLTKVTLNPDEAEDLAQETVVRAIQQVYRFRGESAFSSWLVAIGIRLHLDARRKGKRYREWLEQQRHGDRGRWWKDDIQAEWLDVVEALGRLPVEARTCLVLKHYYGYSYDEIARMTGIRPGTVKSRVHYAIARIRKEVGQGEAREDHRPNPGSAGSDGGSTQSGDSRLDLV